MRKITIVSIAFLAALMLIPQLKADDTIPNANLIFSFIKDNHSSCSVSDEIHFPEKNAKDEMEESFCSQSDDELYNLADIVFENIGAVVLDIDVHDEIMNLTAGTAADLHRLVGGDLAVQHRHGATHTEGSPRLLELVLAAIEYLTEGLGYLLRG